MLSVFSTISGSMWLDRKTTGTSRSFIITEAASVPSIPLPRSMSMSTRSIE